MKPRRLGSLDLLPQTASSRETESILRRLHKNADKPQLGKGAGRNFAIRSARQGLDPTSYSDMKFVIDEAQCDPRVESRRHFTGENWKEFRGRAW